MCTKMEQKTKHCIAIDPVKCRAKLLTDQKEALSLMSQRNFFLLVTDHKPAGYKMPCGLTSLQLLKIFYCFYIK